MKEKLVRGLPIITAILLLLAVCLFFAVWIVLYFKNYHDVKTIILSTFLMLVFVFSAGFEFFKEIQKWRKLKCQEP